jgi:pyruvate/2-oxoglutarate dehydrogenase complex dihydrolipoamide dehydrogenase (E3) component
VTSRADEAKVVGSHLLMAVGRRPNTDDLGVDHAGGHTDAKGYIVVDEQLQTNVEHIWAVGDCNGRGAFYPHLLQRLRDRRGQPARQVVVDAASVFCRRRLTASI